jgi:sulfite exporter TauE/SafE
MCGPLATAACNRQRAAGGPLRYQAGRTIGYVFMGSIAGQLAEVLALRALPAILLPISVACVLAWLSLRVLRRPRSSPIVQLRSTPLRSTPLRRARGAIAQVLPRDPLLLGLLSALLPCGVLGAALLLAAATGTANQGALLMAGFATTSGIGVLGSNFMLQRLLRVQRPGLSRTLAAVLMLAAVFVLVRPMYSFAAALHSSEPHKAHLSCH